MLIGTKTKTSQFLLPIVDMKYNKLLEEGFKNAYISHADEKELEGQRIYLLFEKSKLSDEFREQLKNREDYDKTLTGKKEEIFSFKVPDNIYYTVVIPFMAGKYSEINRSYVNKFFSPLVKVGPHIVHDITYAALTKDSSLKEYWEDRIDMELPEDAEVYSAPIMEEETYYPL